MAEAGEQDWRAWLRRYGAALGMLARQVGAGAEAEDAVQEGFVRFWLARERAREPVGYLFACVRRAAMDAARGRRRRVRREEEAGRPETILAGGPEQTAEERERQRAVEAALGRLPVEQREVVVMKIWGGLSFEQIGAALGISVNTAASRYRYGMEKLAGMLRGADCGGERATCRGGGT